MSCRLRDGLVFFAFMRFDRPNGIRTDRQADTIETNRQQLDTQNSPKKHRAHGMWYVVSSLAGMNASLALGMAYHGIYELVQP